MFYIYLLYTFFCKDISRDQLIIIQCRDRITNVLPDNVCGIKCEVGGGLSVHCGMVTGNGGVHREQ